MSYFGSLPRVGAGRCSQLLSWSHPHEYTHTFPGTPHSRWVFGITSMILTSHHTPVGWGWGWGGAKSNWRGKIGVRSQK